MKFKLVMFILLGLVFTLQNVYANSDVDLDTIPEEYRFPKYNNIAHPPINVEYKGHKGTAMFLSNTLEKGRRNLEVYFLTNNNKELNKAYELDTYQYGDAELVSAFEYADKKTGDKYIYILLKDTLEPNISYSYGFIELPLFIEDDGILRALFFWGDNRVISKTICIDNFQTDERCEFSTKEGLIKYLNKVNE
ncbi:hypothetical protein BGI05_08530 [Snodgrassella alvi]|uniref:hypothetical protein n=1 Tax=Snodgrassella alvi TaxID=1196083 RepID=UPI000A00CA0F|nr:hypothetical protein [Snodgrassella alvi]ORE99355.1 hypothetical protein BGH97_10820 [Snodgrassella alvi]ORF07188.1 hypothetical protein BGH99_09340 [Snodgrassella alvi]ORF10571.1 hypothetical protein BGI00_09050 [Snodgrassella alvi]ORF13228.1 hypothetical protein BGI02_07980 [Snodgrassella alvi]ORF19188.1 hypothetical protein BGI05_08530 [Snodgrassella alvi]